MNQSYDQIASFYAKSFSLDFTQPMQFPWTSDRSVKYYHPFKHMFHDLFNLFSHPFDPEPPTPLDPIQNSATIPITSTTSTAKTTTSTTNSSATTLKPKLTFPSRIPDLSQSFALASSSFNNLTSFPKELTSNSLPITPVRINHQITGPIITPFNCGCAQAKSHVFTQRSFNSQQYIRRFLDVIGDPTAFASHLRHTIILCHFLLIAQSYSVSDICRLTNQFALIICIVHFHIICEYYNIVQCGSLDFAMLVNHVVHLMNPSNKPILHLSQYNDDEIHFLTTILPDAFQSSPMYPGALNKGIIFPSSFNPAQSVTFTQHYTQLLPQSSLDGGFSLSSSPASASSTTKVPTANIPFSIFVYLALLNQMLDLRVKDNYYLQDYNKFWLSVFFHIPNISSNLEYHVIQRFYIPKPSLLIGLNDKLQSLNFKLHQYVRFPILQHDPWASLKSHNSINVINKMISSITKILNSRTKSPLSVSLFGLQLAHIVIVILWSNHINPFTKKQKETKLLQNQQMPVVPNDVNSGVQSSTLSEFRLRYQQSYHSSGDAPTSVLQSTKPIPPNQIASILPTILPILPMHSAEPIDLPEYFKIESILDLVTTILKTTFNNTNNFNILSHFHPSFLFMILSLLTIHDPLLSKDYDYYLIIFLRILAKCRIYNLDPHLDSTIRSIYFEYSCINFHFEAEILLSPPTLSNNTIFQTNILPGINHILASIYCYMYSNSTYRQKNFDGNHKQITSLQSELSTLFNHNHIYSPSSRNYATIVEEMIHCNNGDHAVYRKQSPNFPLTYPSAMAGLEWTFYKGNCNSDYLKTVYKKVMSKLMYSFSYFFHHISVSLLSNNLHYINLTQNVLNSTNIAPLQAYQHPVNQHNEDHTRFIPHSPSLQSSTTMNDQAQHSDITMHSFSHPSTLLGMDPELYCIPYMAIQHNFSRTLFHLISSHDWNNSAEFKVQEKGFFSCESFMPFLLYLNLLHTFLCKPIAIIQMEKELNSNPSASGDKSTPITLFQKLTSLGNNNNNNNDNNNDTNTSNADDSNSKLDALESWNCGIPTSPLPSSLIKPLSLSNQHPLHNMLTVSDPSIITYSSINTATQTSSNPFTFDRFCQTPHYKANLYKHAHLPPSVIKQLYYIYAEALIFTIQGFSSTSFITSQLNDPTTLTLNGTEYKSRQRLDLGISTLSVTACPLYWKDVDDEDDEDDDEDDGYDEDDEDGDEDGIDEGEGEMNHDEDDYQGFPLCKMIDLETKLQWNQLTDFGGTIQPATEMFCSDKYGKLSPLCTAVVQNDSYHKHIMDLYDNPEQMLYSFKPHRNNNNGGAKITVPDYVLDQQRTGTIAIAYEWSSAMVQHSIELFIELLLNEGSYQFVSQIDFSDDKQPLAEEYVIDYIPRDRAHWGDKDKWASNIPPNCTNKDTTFPLYKQFIPTKYQAQIPTLATAAMCPSDPELLPHSIYHPDNTTQEQRDALINHYAENPSLVPAFVFSSDEVHKLKNLGFKTPTRGHLPYFYNLSTDDQDKLYEIFSFPHLTLTETNSITSYSSSSPTTTIYSPATATKPLSLDIDFAEYFNHMNNDLPHHFQQEMLLLLKKASLSSSNNEISLQNHQDRLSSQSQFMVEHYAPALSGSSASSFTSQDIIDIFTAPSINAEYITPNTQHLYSTLPPSITTPQLLPATFTIPTSLLIAQIQLKEGKQLE